MSTRITTGLELRGIVIERKVLDEPVIVMAANLERIYCHSVAIIKDLTLKTEASSTRFHNVVMLESKLLSELLLDRDFLALLGLTQPNFLTKTLVRPTV